MINPSELFVELGFTQISTDLFCMIRYVETIQNRIESSNIYLKKFLKRLLEIRIVGNLSGLPVKVKEVSSGNIFNF